MSPEFQRVLTVPGVSNFRDAGGYATAEGGRVAERRLFRAAHVGRVDDEGGAHFRRLGIATIVDLRGAEERTADLPAFAEAHGIRVVSTPIEPGSLPALRRLAADSATTPQAVRNVMMANYRRYALEETAVVGRALAAIADAVDRPVVVHCTAGKDRTGFVVAVILSVLGVPRETVLDDYLISNTAWDRQYRRTHDEVLSADANCVSSPLPFWSHKFQLKERSLAPSAMVPKLEVLMAMLPSADVGSMRFPLPSKVSEPVASTTGSDGLVPDAGVMSASGMLAE